MPGVSVGTMNMLIRSVSLASGSVTARTSRKAASLAFDENHFSPSISHSSSPLSFLTKVARQVNSPGSAPPCGSVIEKQETISPSISGPRYFCFCSGVPNMARISALPVSGAAVPNTVGAQLERPIISFINASLTWPYPGPPRLGPRWQAHRPCAFTCSCNGLRCRRASLMLVSKLAAISGHNRSITSHSSRTNLSIQSSLAWNSGSMLKSIMFSLQNLLPLGRIYFTKSVL